jgi:hypothetical protein
MRYRCMLRIITAVAACILCVFCAEAARAGAVPSAPAMVLRASSVYSAELRGYVGMQRHFTTVISGAVHHSESSDSGQVMRNGAFVAISYYRIVRDGSPLPNAQIAQRNAQTNTSWRAGKVFFKEPYDRRYIADYQFGAVRDAAGQTSVAFSSSIHDAQHGAGTMWIDDRSAHVLKLTYSPYVLPQHATSGTVTETGGQALPHLWYVVRIDESYQGHILLLHGTGVFTGTFDHFRRFHTMQLARAVLMAGTI